MKLGFVSSHLKLTPLLCMTSHTPVNRDHNQRGRLKPLNQDFSDGNPTRKQDFIDPEHLSRFRSHILIVMTFRYSPFDVDFVTIFKKDAMMMTSKMQVKPFDVLIENRIANVTSVDCATHLVDECHVEHRKG